MPVGELLTRMSSRELSEWQQFYAVEPFGEERADIRSAISAAAIVTSLRGLGGVKRPVKAEAFMPFHGAWDEGAEPKSLVEKIRENPLFQSRPGKQKARPDGDDRKAGDRTQPR